MATWRRRGAARALGAGIVLLAWCGAADAAGASSDAAGPLTLQEAVGTAVAHHPSLAAALGATAAQAARVGEARANFFPQLTLTSGFSRGQEKTLLSKPPTFTPYTAVVPEHDYSAQLSLQQLLFDFGKTNAQVQAAAQSLAASRQDQESSRQAVVLNVKVAYFGLLAARRLVQVDEETVKQFQEHLEQVRGFYDAGTRTRYDVTTAAVNLTNAQLDLIKAKDAARVAEVTLANAMGTPERRIGEMEELLTVQQTDVSEEQALNEATARRPELRSFAAQRLAAEASIRAAQRDYFPVVTGSADYTFDGSGFPLPWSRTAGVSLTFPLFSGLLTRSQVAEAHANLETVDANAEALRQNIVLEVRQAYANLIDADERVRASAIVVQQAEENLALADGRFQAGIGTSVELTDAQVQLANAKTSQVQALYDDRVAIARLDKAMGHE